MSFLCLRGFELTGGSHGLRLAQCRDVWVDQCHIHHNNQVCLSANSADTQRLHLTRNHKVGVTCAGNVVLGDGPKDGCTQGRGLEDFRNLAWDASERDATPTADAPLEKADLNFLLETDFNNTRIGSKTSGAVAREAL